MRAQAHQQTAAESFEEEERIVEEEKGCIEVEEMESGERGAARTCEATRIHLDVSGVDWGSCCFAGVDCCVAGGECLLSPGRARAQEAYEVSEGACYSCIRAVLVWQA